MDSLKSENLQDLEEIKKVRRQLKEYNPAAGSLEVVFYLPNGEAVRVSVSDLARKRMLSKEVRNYLAEFQLLKQCSVN